MLLDYFDALKNTMMPPRKVLQKKGTLSIGVVETTPVVWKGELLRFEWVRNFDWGNEKGSQMGNYRDVGCYHFVNMKTEEPTPEFAFNHSFGCCYEEDGIMYVHGVEGSGGGQVINTFWSDDLVNWHQQTALVFPEDIPLYNTSVCKGPDGYVMAIEIGGNNPVAGKPFTCVFAKSADLLHWELLPMEEYVYDLDRYTACPTIRYTEGYYYIIYLEHAPCYRFIPYIVRTKDLKEFELGVRNPIMFYDDQDKQIIYPEKFSEEEIAYITNAVDSNNSDVDLCEYEGKTVILYSWGNQSGNEFLGMAEYDGSMTEFLQSFFA